MKCLADMESIYRQKGIGRPVQKTNACNNDVVEDLIQIYVLPT